MVQDATTILYHSGALAEHSGLVHVICLDSINCVCAAAAAQRSPDSGSEVRRRNELSKNFYMEHTVRYYCLCVSVCACKGLFCVWMLCSYFLTFSSFSVCIFFRYVFVPACLIRLAGAFM